MLSRPWAQPCLCRLLWRIPFRSKICWLFQKIGHTKLVLQVIEKGSNCLIRGLRVRTSTILLSTVSLLSVNVPVLSLHSTSIPAISSMAVILFVIAPCKSNNDPLFQTNFKDYSSIDTLYTKIFFPKSQWIHKATSARNLSIIFLLL